MDNLKMRHFSFLMDVKKGTANWSNYSQTPLIRPSLIRLNGSPAKNGLKQISPH